MRQARALRIRRRSVHFERHVALRMALAFGMTGMFIVHPRQPRGPRVDRDFALMTHEWRLNVGARRPDPSEMTDFNVLTFNSRSFPGTAPLLVGKGDGSALRRAALRSIPARKAALVPAYPS